ncbi:MAG: LysM peptidoglycan-binding domain-containing protein [Roseibacillus sp.]|nr:LysM peptidoglycan-binding domain-containing protein [Roseibacillus sp.]
MIGIIKVIAAVIVLAVLAATFFLVERLREESAAPQLGVVPEVPSGVALVKPGEIAFDRARELLATGQFKEAREKLEFLVGVYPSSSRASEARRILGELNLDDLLSTEVMEGKVMYKVKSGDNFTRIAQSHDTTLDCIMHMNGLQRMDKLFPGDELVLLPLNFNIKIDIPRKLLSLYREGRLLKSYELLHAKTREGSGELRSKIGQKIGLLASGGSVSPVKFESYRNARKVLILDHRGLQLREVTDSDQEEVSRGFFLSGADIEELALLLRVGNEVEVRFAKR